MDYFAENAAPVWVLGALLLTMAGIVYAHTRRTGALLAAVAVVLLTGAGLLAERLFVTPREEVQNTLLELLRRAEADDLPGVLAMVDSNASAIHADAELLMPKFEIHSAGANGEIEVTVDPDGESPTASAAFDFGVNVSHRTSGFRGPYFDEVVIHFRKRGDRWVITDYTTEKDWRRDASRL